MDRLTRKELKQDKFALEVGHTVEYFSEHRKQAIRYGTIGLTVVLVVVGVFSYRRYQQSARQQALSNALEVMGAPVGPAQGEVRSYPTELEREKAATKALSEVASKYDGSDEGDIARYYLGVMLANAGKTADAEKQLASLAGSGNANYASLGKVALAEIYHSQGKTAEGEKLLRSLIAKPTDFVSKEQATIALGRLLASKKPVEARKLLEPLRTDRSTVSRYALTILSEVPQK